MPPVRAVSTIEIVGFAPGTTSTVTDPAFVSTPLAAYARIANVRLGPAGTLIVSAATPLLTGMLKRRGGVMSGALTSTTTIAAELPAASTRTKRAVEGPPVRPGSRHDAKATSDASARVALHGARGMGRSLGRVRPAAAASSAPTGGSHAARDPCRHRATQRQRLMPRAGLEPARELPP